MLDGPAVGMVGVAAVLAAAFVLTFWLALKGSAPSERAAIIAALAAVVVALVDLLLRRPRDGAPPE
ncbi:hypothetical protein [Glycomyces terrestris]|uniref:Uncharacterized protein n=1 Tax=Glycomyces terrestris TaxID=2493553 RepID=A0A426UW00_9ACTN|nr:hypothetical protein [Glycomyces terrestris]RRR98507.1 hypothetical protein EIW28_16655 [Glycomyces terrestris]